jgi:uncharacterized protein YkwD
VRAIAYVWPLQSSRTVSPPVTVVTVGLESRDWYREEYRKSRKPRTSRWLVLFLAIGAFAIVAVSPPVSDRLGYEPPFGIGELFDGKPSSVGLQVFPGGPTLTTFEEPIYARDDPWKEWLAPESACPHTDQTTRSAAQQTDAMLCLLNYARRRQHLAPLKLSALLSRTSASKASDIVRCKKFAHEPCGRPANEAALDAGYRGSFGENIYIAEGRLVTPRVAVDRWLNSPGHRENLFRPEWHTVGIARLPGADLERFEDGVIWVNEFGDR